ncbi:MAG: DUF421 domain-containing protein [Clostridia bacterium]|nr:DUF421 domain-containing protein [Clostridia bacterium]
MEIQKIFSGGPDLPFWAFAIRTTLLYFALITATRLMGKRQIGILSGHNYLVAAGIVSLAAVRMVNPQASLTSGLVIIFVYAGMNILWSYLDLKWPWGIDRKPITLVENGQVSKKNLLKSTVTMDNLMGQLRLKGAQNLSEVASAVLEVTGKISVSKKPQFLPLNRKQMKLPPKPVTLPTVLIYDGKVEAVNLSELGQDLNWLLALIRQKGYGRPEDIFLAAVEADGTLYIAPQPAS